MSSKSDRIRELAQKEELTWAEREELASLNGMKLGTPEEEQRKVELVERILSTPDPVRCRYSDCIEQHPEARDYEQVTCNTCRKYLGLPELGQP